MPTTTPSAPLSTTPLQWSASLSLDMPLMDSTHQEFVALLGEVATAPDTALLTRWALLIDHTQEHFDREDQWMAATGFASGNCHATQHSIVLQVMREGGKRGLGGDLAIVRQMASELALWFPQHAQSMDAALALHLRSAGYDPVTGAISQADALPATPIHGCGGNSCAPAAAKAQPETADASPT